MSILLSTPTPPGRALRRSISTTPPSDWFSDSRAHGHEGSTRNVRMQRVVHDGGGAISGSQDGTRCAVAGPGSLRILRFSDPTQSLGGTDHKSAVGRGGYRIDASRNMWEGSGLKLDSTSTDVVWCSGFYENKVLTSARNGELIMWDLNKSGSTKYECRIKDHHRSIHQLSVSQAVPNYCITGSADGDLRVWDLKNFNKSIMRIHHPTSVRSIAFSPNASQPLHAITGLDNGSIYRWDLRMGQRGQLDRLLVAHAGSVTSLDWASSSSVMPSSAVSEATISSTTTDGDGWLASGGLDRTVKVWDLNSSGHIPHKPTYTLHPSFAVRTVLWRPRYECELAIVPNIEFGAGPNTEVAENPATTEASESAKSSSLGVTKKNSIDRKKATLGDPLEIWDVRKGWIAKWSVSNSAIEGGVTDIAFRDHHALWAQHASGSFSQFDLRDCVRPIDAITPSATTWDAAGSLTFASNRTKRWEIPYDDVPLLDRARLEEKWLLKTIGDRPFVPMTQSLGTFTEEVVADDVETISKLARGYTLEGSDSQMICAVNAEVACDAGQFNAAQVWLLIGSLLTDILPDEPPQDEQVNHLAIEHTSLLHSASAPSRFPIVTSGYTFPPTQPMPGVTSSESAPTLGQQKRRTSLSPLHYTSGSKHLVFPSAPPSGRATRSSSNSTNSVSPRKKLSPLPALSPLPLTLADRRPSMDSSKSGNTMSSSGRRTSLFRRLSSTAYNNNMSPGDKLLASLRAKNVGEGALDDSDEDDSDEDTEDPGRFSGLHSPVGNDDGDLEPTGLDLQSLASPGLLPSRGPPQPSPLSKPWSEDESEAGGSVPQHRDDDGDDENSVSPRSTDTESGGSDSPGRPPAIRRRSSAAKAKRIGRRSRSSTVASLAAGGNSTTQSPALTRQESQSSIRTVVAGDTSLLHPDDSATDTNSRTRYVVAEDTITLENTRNRADRGSFGNGNAHNRQKSVAKSVAVSEFALNSEFGIDENHRKVPRLNDLPTITDRNPSIVRRDEQRMRDLGWQAMRDAIEVFAEEGDVQTCAMLALVVPRELKLSPVRAVRFVEAYIELLNRLGLPTPTAYVRKFTKLEEVRSESMRQTDIYTSCGKCRKALTPATTSGQTLLKGGFAYCSFCRTSNVKCAICRLPVKALLMQCAVCGHGGHLYCYQRYYSNLPKTEIPPSNSANSDPPPAPSPPEKLKRTLSYQMTPAEVESKIVFPSSFASSTSSHSNHPPPFRLARKMVGHPCAAGCGHFCWASCQESAFTT